LTLLNAALQHALQQLIEQTQCCVAALKQDAWADALAAMQQREAPLATLEAALPLPQALTQDPLWSTWQQAEAELKHHMQDCSAKCAELTQVFGHIQSSRQHLMAYHLWQAADSPDGLMPTMYTLDG
jgi:hypothetical protein